jgi:predicted O-methyltransferase YrrM
MSYRRLAEAMLQGRPYFGPALRALQGPPERHKYIRPVVKSVAKNAGPLEILEIGSWAGASAISWAAALKELGLPGHVTCVDAWLPYFDLEKDKGGHYERMNRAAETGMVYKLFQHNVSCSGFAGTIEAKVGGSRQILPSLSRRSFDVIYIDGSHTLEDVLFDVREAKRLIRPKGIICGDDLELQLRDLDPKEVEAAAGSGQDYVLYSSSGVSYHPGVTLAVAREFGEVRAWDGFWAARFSGKWRKVALDLAESELPAHVASAAIRLEGDMPAYHLISNQDRYFALAKQLGPPDVAAEILGDEELQPLVLTGSTLEEIRQKVEQQRDGQPARKSVNVGPDLLYPFPQVVGSYRGFNVVCCKDTIYGLRQSLGEVDLSVGVAALQSQYDDQDAIICNSLDGVKARIDAIEAERAVRELTERLRELDEHSNNT